MQTLKIPYEVLIRFGDDGEVRGSHVIWQYIVKDGDKIVANTIGSAEPAGEDGSDFPLSKAVSVAIGQGLGLAGSKLNDAEAQIASLTSERDKAREALNQLVAELKEAKNPTPAQE